ncbi:NAD-dependent succinate-semialdehyde dehydrogenase [Prolixibacter denitrificans]|uniref:Aldehyde dehydrogenase n=1 Tax=Prolixibacter denitrificans TaxID=1541063 RepID=A0A2P8CGA0_9BACT|nr:NAD-dependent succinate-semialdehyde dehydrogenase [Prolixibacter denitrificans]PSK84008.1 succinate-semialdehyde dehydrogenase/glutarate-semialdehyde dehydrogenase [Prolixibacter denitrificans]GET23550.1 aldehyde dehydrogenase [Prolixibacter denitrificans]
MKSINPATGELIKEYSEMSEGQVKEVVDLNFEAWKGYRETSFAQRSQWMQKAAELLRSRREEYARLITAEMGKRIAESYSEVEKCAWVCEYYAENAEQMLVDELMESDATKSMAVFNPLGPVLAVMPWNFPFWQVFRFAAPALMAGNAGLLKHASNVQGCALAIEEVFRDAGFPENIFRTLVISSSKVEAVIAHPAVKAVTLTGSEYAGSQVASLAGKYLKKSVLELGGSDPFIVLADADLEKAAKVAVGSRMITSGQTCIAAKRFIVEQHVAAPFLEKVKALMEAYEPGDPGKEETSLAPLARPDLVDDIDNQVKKSVEQGAQIISGGSRVEGIGNYYSPTILTNVSRGMPVYMEETFGPVAVVLPVEDEKEAIEVANDSLYGLGASLWTSDLKKGEELARKIEAGAVFVNGLVKSDPRLPFGGIKNSGYGRELSGYGIKEFVNIKTVWIK